MKFPTEMHRLRFMLDAMGIKWHDKSDIVSEDLIAFGYPDVTIYRTKFEVCSIKYSVICGCGTYGGEHELLEMMVGGADPEGYLTADDVISDIQRRLMNDGK